MKKYESVIIIKPMKEQNKIDDTINKFKEIMESFSNKEVEVETIGLKKLAYEINKNKEGYYAVYNFYAETENIRELERIYRITDEVMKFLVVDKECENNLEDEDEEEEDGQ